MYDGVGTSTKRGRRATTNKSCQKTRTFHSQRLELDTHGFSCFEAGTRRRRRRSPSRGWGSYGIDRPRGDSCLYTENNIRSRTPWQVHIPTAVRTCYTIDTARDGKGVAENRQTTTADIFCDTERRRNLHPGVSYTKYVTTTTTCAPCLPAPSCLPKPGSWSSGSL